MEGLPPFAGGFVGYFAYAMMEYAEPTLSIQRDDMNDFDMMLFDKIIAYDHLKQKITLIVNIKTDHVMENYGKHVPALNHLYARFMTRPHFHNNLFFKSPTSVVMFHLNNIVT